MKTNEKNNNYIMAFIVIFFVHSNGHQVKTGVLPKMYQHEINKKKT